MTSTSNAASAAALVLLYACATTPEPPLPGEGVTAPPADAGVAPPVAPAAPPSTSVDAGAAAPIDAGASAPRGACANPSDMAIGTASTFSQRIEQCATTCFLTGGGGACMASCLQMQAGLSAPCAACSGTQFDCVSAACTPAPCGLGSAMSPECVSCQCTRCVPQFAQCSGIPMEQLCPG